MEAPGTAPGCAMPMSRSVYRHSQQASKVYISNFYDNLKAQIRAFLIERPYFMSYIEECLRKIMFNLVKLVGGVMFGVLGIYYLTGYLLMFFADMGFNSFLYGAASALGFILIAYGAFYFVNLKKVEPEFDMEDEPKITMVRNEDGYNDPEILPDQDFGRTPQMKDVTPTSQKKSKTIH